jgi:hypothetical protein
VRGLAKFPLISGTIVVVATPTVRGLHPGSRVTEMAVLHLLSRLDICAGNGAVPRRASPSGGFLTIEPYRHHDVRMPWPHLS